MRLRGNIILQNVICYRFLWVSALIPTLLIASSKDLPSDFYHQVNSFLQSNPRTSEPLAQGAHQIVERLTELTENRENFVQGVKELKSYLRLVGDFSQPQTLQRTLLLEEELNTHVASFNEEAKRKRSRITWIALAMGTLVGFFGVIVRVIQEESLHLSQIKAISLNMLIWAPITIGGGLSLGNLIAAKEVDQRQVLLVHPAELIRDPSLDMTVYEIESHLKTFLATEKGFLRSQAQKKLHALHSKAPERVKARIRYMEEVLEHAPPQLSPSKEKQQERLEALQENLSLSFPPLSSWDKLRYFLSDHLYEFAVVGALLGIAIFLLSLHLSRTWSWPSVALSILIGLNVGFTLGQMVGELVKKETPHELIQYEVLF